MGVDTTTLIEVNGKRAAIGADGVPFFVGDFVRIDRDIPGIGGMIVQVAGIRLTEADRVIVLVDGRKRAGYADYFTRIV